MTAYPSCLPTFLPSCLPLPFLLFFLFAALPISSYFPSPPPQPIPIPLHTTPIIEQQSHRDWLPYSNFLSYLYTFSYLILFLLQSGSVSFLFSHSSEISWHQNSPFYFEYLCQYVENYFRTEYLSSSELACRVA